MVYRMTRESVGNADRLSFYRNMKDVKILKGYQEIYNHLRKRNMAIRDDYVHWALHGEKSEYGKVLLMNEEDTNVQQIFFDDCGSYVVNSRDIQNIDKHLSFEELNGLHVFSANSYAIMIDDNYFIDHVIEAQKRFSDKYNINSK